MLLLAEDSSTHILSYSDYPAVKGGETNHNGAPKSAHTWWPLHHTSFRLLVKDMVVEFLSNDLKISKACFRHLFEWIYTENAPVTLGCVYTCGERNFSILQARKGLSRMLLTEGLSRGLRLNSCTRRERSSWE